MSRFPCRPRVISEVLADISFVGSVAVPDTVVTGISQDSRKITPGDVYCCVRGETSDGHTFIDSAIDNGAVALIVDRHVDGVPQNVSLIQVDDVRRFIGDFAASLFDFPCRHLRMVGVTGTNGKTSTTAIIASILQANGETARQVGTLSGARTTPEAIELQAQFASWVADGVSSVVMEVSSHALVQHRVGGIVFDVAVFTNIGRDHLDFHGTEEAYFAAKAQLFSDSQSRRGVVNVDDPKGQLLSDAMTIPIVGYSMSDISEVSTAIDSVSYVWRGLNIHVPLGGSFSVVNSLAAVTAVRELGVPDAAIIRGVSMVPQVPGRFESIANTCGVGVIVDYAHTPESMESLLASVRQVCRGRLITVFGCGGNRDAGKRPLMGEIASSMSDVVIITSDNPRRENPDDIISDIFSGITGTSSHVQRVPDRRQAIESAILMAGRDDIVVIAGKGHESTQEIMDTLHPFNDADVARMILRHREETTQ